MAGTVHWQAGWQVPTAGNNAGLTQVYNFGASFSSATHSAGVFTQPLLAGEQVTLQGFGTPGSKVWICLAQFSTEVGNLADGEQLEFFRWNNFHLFIERASATNYVFVIENVTTEVGRTTTEFTFGHANKYDLRYEVHNGDFYVDSTAEIEGLSAISVSGNPLLRCIHPATDDAGSSWQVAEVCGVSSESGADRPDHTTLNALASAPDSNGEHYTEATSGTGTNPDYQDLDDWVAGNADSATTVDSLPGGGKENHRQTYDTVDLSLSNIKSVMVALNWAASADKGIDCYILATDGTASHDMESALRRSVIAAYATQRHIYNLAPDSVAWTDANFDTTEFGLRGEQDDYVDEPVNADMTAIHVEALGYDLDAEPAAAAAPQVYHQRHHNMAL